MGKPRRSLADQAFDALEHQLVTLELEPGAALKEQELAESLGMGRTPVREAIQKLSAQGLLQVIPRKGLRVKAVSRGELVQFLEVRRVLERLLVVKAAERASHDQRLALMTLARHLDGLSDDLNAFMRMDRRLDELLGDACGNPHLTAALAPIHAHCRRLWFMNLPRVDLSSASTFHAALARSVMDGDGGGAVRALNGIMSMLETLVNDLRDEAAALASESGGASRLNEVGR